MVNRIHKDFFDGKDDGVDNDSESEDDNSSEPDPTD